MTRVVALAVGLLACSVGHAVSAQEAAAPTLQDGVFSEAQVERGRSRYQTLCSQCHGVSLEGVEDAPDLGGKPFLTRWGDVPVGALFDFIMTQMPPGSPGSLGAGGTIDVVAYILSRNDFPAGANDLPPDERIYDIFIDPPAP